MLQVVADEESNEHVSKPMVGFLNRIPNESIVDVTGVLTKSKVELKSCSIKLELHIHQVRVIDKSLPKLPFQLKDASRPLKEGEEEGLGELKPGEKPQDEK